MKQLKSTYCIFKQLQVCSSKVQGPASAPHQAHVPQDHKLPQGTVTTAQAAPLLTSDELICSCELQVQ